MRRTAKAALSAAAAAALLGVGWRAWPRDLPVVYVRRFANLSVHTGHDGLVELERGLRDGIVARLLRLGKVRVLTCDDDDDSSIDLTISGAFALTGHRRLLAAARVADGRGELVTSGSWTCDALEPEQVTDRAARWTAAEVQAMPDGTDVDTAGSPYSDVVRAAEGEANSAEDLESAIDDANGLDPNTAALLRFEIAQISGDPLRAAAALAAARDAPRDCLLGLQAWSAAYDALSDGGGHRAVAAAAAERAVATYPDIPMTWRTLALHDPRQACEALRNAVLLEAAQGSTWVQQMHLADLARLAPDRREKLAAAATGVLYGLDESERCGPLLASLEGRTQRPYEFGTRARIAADRRLWSVACRTEDAAVLSALAEIARVRLAHRGHCFVPDNAAAVLHRTRLALCGAATRGPRLGRYPALAALAALGGAAQSEALAALPAWRRGDYAPEPSWQPIHDQLAAARRSRYPERPRVQPDYAAALGAYGRVLTVLDPDSRHAAATVNDMLASLQRHDLALAFWSQLVSVCPDSPNCARGYAEAALRAWEATAEPQRLKEARDAVGRFLSASGWSAGSVLDAVNRITQAGGTGNRTDGQDLPSSSPLLSDGLAYIDHLRGPPSPPAMALRAWTRAQSGHADEAVGGLQATVGAMAWERRSWRAVRLPDPLSLHPGGALRPCMPSKALVLKGLAEAYLRAGDACESGLRAMNAGETHRLELTAPLYRRAVHPVHFVIYGSTLAAFVPSASPAGEELVWWFGAGSRIEHVMVRDLDGDGTCEVVLGTRSDGSDHAAVYVLDDRGRMLARRELGSDAVYPLGRRYIVNALQVLDVDGDGKLEIAAAANHDNETPGRIVVMDRRLDLMGDYWHPGHIQALAPWKRTPGGSGAELAFAALNNEMGAPGQMVAVIGCLRTRRLASGDARRPGGPYVTAVPMERTLYRQATDLGIRVPPNTLSPQANGVLHAYVCGAPSELRPHGILIDHRGARVGTDDRPPDLPPDAARCVPLSAPQFIAMWGVTNYHRLPPTDQLRPGLAKMRATLSTAHCALLTSLDDSQVSRQNVLRYVSSEIGRSCRTGTALWIHFSGHAFAARLRGNDSDIYLQMQDATGPRDARHAVSVRELWRDLGMAAPNSRVLLTLDCCLTEHSARDRGAAVETLRDLCYGPQRGPAPVDGAILTACEGGATATAGRFLKALTAVLEDPDTGDITARGLFDAVRGQLFTTRSDRGPMLFDSRHAIVVASRRPRPGAVGGVRSP